jgi:hypothetical protein
MNMWTDPIVEEVRRVREQHAAKFDYDIGRIVADVKKREQESTRVVVAAPDRKQLAEIG